MKKMNRNHETLKILMVPIFYPSKNHTWSFDKMFDIALCDNYDLSVLFF